jgi:hypothetical protein
MKRRVRSADQSVDRNQNTVDLESYSSSARKEVSMAIPMDRSSIERDYLLEQWTRTLQRIYQVRPAAQRGAALEAAWLLLRITIRDAFPPEDSEMWIKKVNTVMETLCQLATNRTDLPDGA